MTVFLVHKGVTEFRMTSQWQEDLVNASWAWYEYTKQKPASYTWSFWLLRSQARVGIIMGSMWSGRVESKQQMEMALSKAKQIVSSNPVVVFSKTYCGYCKKVKKLFSQLDVSYKLVELDEESDGSEIQSALREWTGQGTVPNVFIGGKHIGGSDAVMEKHEAGKLVPMLTEAGVIANNSAQLSSI